MSATIVFRDDAYGNVARDLDDLFGGTYETDLLNPDLVKFTESFGAVGMRASDPMELGDTADPSGPGTPGAGGHRRASKAYASAALQDASEPSLSALDPSPGRPDNLLSVRSPLLRKRPDARRTAGCRRRRWA